MAARTLLICILPFAILFGSASPILLSAAWYETLFAKLDVYSQFTQTKEEINRETASLLAFLQGEQELSPGFFNEREILHLHDVQKLMRWYRALAFFFLFAATILLFLTWNDKKALLYAGFSSLVFLAVILLLSLFQFSSLFLTFHEVFFMNDFWMLNPETDNLIKLFPEPFFLQSFSRILHISIAISMMFIILGTYRVFHRQFSRRFI